MSSVRILPRWIVCLAVCLPFSAGDMPATMSAQAEENAAATSTNPAPSNQDLASPPQSRLLFELDVLPVLTAAGCNSGPCHGKSRGQNGFQLSLLGFDADFDYQSIVENCRGRRISVTSPESSLILKKASAKIPHGGGIRLRTTDKGYQLFKEWIAQGAPRATPKDPVVTRVDVEPAERGLTPGESLPLRVIAQYSDGSTRDVTELSAFQSSNTAVVSVNGQGTLLAGKYTGEATVMIRYMGRIATWNTLIPLSGEVDPAVYSALPSENPLDAAVWKKLQQLRMIPSPAVDDAKWLRRVHLDLIGRLPTPEEVRTFLSDSAPDKRARAVDALLLRPEYADFWANKFADLLRPNPYRVGIKATLSMDRWIRDAFRKNMPYDQLVRELVTAQGSTWRNGATVLYRDHTSPDELAPVVSQLFLGVRLDCAKCHHHPFEVWGQEDFYGLAAFFSRVGRKGTGLSPPISGGEEIFFSAPSGEVRHPRTNEVLLPKPLLAASREIPADVDPRAVLADWMTSPDNPYFSRAAVNRIWGELLGVGIVEPVDDLRATNPPSNPELLDLLANDFKQDYDVKRLLKSIVLTQVYGLSSEVTERNAQDHRNFSRHYRQRLRAEVLLDAICDVTNMPETFQACPSDVRAVAIWTNRSDSTFLDTFGRPDRNQDPPCERTTGTTVVQALHLMNADATHDKITSDQSAVRQLVKSDMSNRQIVEELYLLCYSRYPTPEELSACEAYFPSAATADRSQTVEDLLWAMFNTPEFVFKD